MLARANRLTSSRGFADTIRRGGRAGTSTMAVHLASWGSSEPPRIGLVVGRTVGNAVVRNQVKRRLRHVARDRLDRLPAGAMLVLRALPTAADAPSAALARDLDRALERLLHGGAGR